MREREFYHRERREHKDKAGQIQTVAKTKAVEKLRDKIVVDDLGAAARWILSDCAIPDLRG